MGKIIKTPSYNCIQKKQINILSIEIKAIMHTYKDFF